MHCMSDVWGALADATRREILTLLQKQDMTAGEIGEHFDFSGATISHHLKILKEAELVRTQRQAQKIIYSLNTTVFQDFLRGVAAMLDKEEK